MQHVIIKIVIMAKIELRLSSKVQSETGRQEVLIRFHEGKKFCLYEKSGIYVSPEYFEYYIDRAKTEANNVSVPSKLVTITQKKAESKGYVLFNRGIICVSNHRLETPEVKWHKEKAESMEQLSKFIIECYEKSAKSEIQGDWLKNVVERYNHPQIVEKHEKTFYELTDDYIKRRGLAESHARVYYVLQRAVSRYEGFTRATDKDRKKWMWDINKITREDIEDFSDFLRNESTLAEKYPTLFAKLYKSYPNNVKPGHSKVEARGGNTIIKMRTRLKSLFLWFYEEGFTTNRPFDGVKIGTAKVGTPYYITIEERNKIADTDLAAVWETMTKDERKPARMPLKTLIEQRDIFVFQCFIGCRVGDLLKMTDSCINNGILVYTPHKTKDEGFESFQARVPLHPKALELIEKYRGVDSKGRLFPFITAQRYNDAIKVIFTMAGITRKVEVRNPKTGENEYKPINEIASSHLARRTFVGNAYFKVSDPNLIGKMSGHVEGSKAFKRYRRIEDETLRNVIDLIG